MNPIRDWEECRINEIKAGGNPSVCILGWHDYSKLCGAIMAVNCIESFGTTDFTEYRGIRLFASRSKDEGIMFA